MKDLNFFENYIEKSELNIDKRLILYFFTMTLAIILLFYTLFNQIKIRQLSRDVKKLQVILEDERINNKMQDIEEKQIEVKEFNESLEMVRILDKGIEED